MKIIDQCPETDHGVYHRLRIWRVVLAALVILLALDSWLLMGCSTRTLVVMPDGTVNATVTAVGYCPEATLIRAHGVEMLSEASGVGAVVRDVVGVVK